ncbi:M10 family metallopeptidase C-terminal domain-containing protein [Rhodobacter capsulatus]|uniref:Serralysin n=1 Tax=Rhodobacter capsulatus TaxID=1061 RepID=A0A1G7QE18_RHOCA|nr:M10 family metallopeptidase C-terminal domain-containing protein [Rhodobacter capsulatus]WER09553.1 M10 family metallopeptidase C-terminal domain-containing protein [Rhodobacter capsulatus]SDF96728.1 serralysin [Rhodobacter capsulatus]
MTRQISEFLRAAAADPVHAAVNEGADAGAGTSTGYTMGLGDTFNGTISTSGDRDGVRINLVAGQTYQFTLNGVTLTDPYLRLYDAAGNQIAYNDDANGTNSQITFTATTSGTYFIEAAGYGTRTGSYALTAAQVVPASLDTLADYLVNGFWESNGEQARRFDTTADNVITVDLHNLTADGQQLARWALQAWSATANLVFVETTGTADIEFDDSDDGAYSTSNTTGTRINSSFVNIDTAWIANYGTTMDGYSLQTYIHEIGHALGLGHQGAYNGSATYPDDATFVNDSWHLSIMSYFDQNDNTTTGVSFAWVMSAMMSDIIAIQSMYGASTTTTGSTVYGRNSNVGGYLETLFDSLVAGTSATYGGDPVTMTIYDAGGRDTIDFSFSNVNQTLNLAPGSFSNLAGLVGNLGIARGTVIEIGATGNGNDLIMGNNANNTLMSRGGNDTLRGGAGNDKLDGGAGNDFIDGSTGKDTLIGGAGQNTFLFNVAVTAANADIITDFRVVDDTIRLDRSFFTGIAATGTLTANAFTKNTSGQATDALDRIIYETDTGALWYDADGTGGTARVLVATLGTGLAMTNADFFVVA